MCTEKRVYKKNCRHCQLGILNSTRPYYEHGYCSDISVLLILILALGAVSVTSTQEVVSIAPVAIAGDGGSECPSGEERQAAQDLLLSMTEGVLQNPNTINEQGMQNYSFNPNCGPGLWRRVFYLNTSSQNQSCPGDWNVRTVSSVGGCAGADLSCRSAYSDEASSIASYSKVCGRAVGRSTTSPDGFDRTISGKLLLKAIT